MGKLHFAFINFKKQKQLSTAQFHLKITQRISDLFLDFFSGHFFFIFTTKKESKKISGSFLGYVFLDGRSYC